MTNNIIKFKRNVFLLPLVALLFVSPALAQMQIGEVTRKVVNYSFMDTLKFVHENIFSAIGRFPENFDGFTVAAIVAIIAALTPTITFFRQLVLIFKGKITNSLLPALAGAVLTFYLIAILGGLFYLPFASKESYRFHWCHSTISKSLPDISDCKANPISK